MVMAVEIETLPDGFKGGDDALAAGELPTVEPHVPRETNGAPAGEQELLVPLSVGELMRTYPTLRPAVIRGLQRSGETMNIIAAPKVGKSWLVTGLA